MTKQTNHESFSWKKSQLKICRSIVFIKTSHERCESSNQNVCYVHLMVQNNITKILNIFQNSNNNIVRIV